MTAREILQILRRDGWKEIEIQGSHIQMKHPTKPGKVTIPRHGGDVHPKTVKSIMKQAGLGYSREKKGE